MGLLGRPLGVAEPGLVGLVRILAMAGTEQ